MCSNECIFPKETFRRCALYFPSFVLPIVWPKLTFIRNCLIDWTIIESAFNLIAACHLVEVVPQIRDRVSLVKASKQADSLIRVSEPPARGIQQMNGTVSRSPGGVDRTSRGRPVSEGLEADGIPLSMIKPSAGA